MLNKSPLVLLLFPLLLAGCHHHQPTPRAAASATEVDDLFASLLRRNHQVGLPTPDR